jgi:16S rRNA (cytidine1402-2'-O)-methyltransferase
MKQKGTLYLVPSTLGGSDIRKGIPDFNLLLLNQLNEFVVEEVRSARRFLRIAGFSGDFESITFHILNEHSQPGDVKPAITSLLGGSDVGLLSEAGLPCVADPGNELVREAHASHIRVVPLTGPSSVMLALMASGFNGQNFAFLGYLPIHSKDRAIQIRLLEKRVYQYDQTQIFIEAPYRNLQLLSDIISTCADDTALCIACDLTLDTEWIRSMRISDWRKTPPPALHKRPAVFLIYK